MSNFSQLDSELLSGYLDNLGKDIVQQMLDLYVQQSVIYLKDIEEAVEQASQELWQERCHKMKGATGSAGLTALHAFLVTIEKSTESWVEKRKQLAQLSELNRQAIDEFNLWFSQQQ